MSDAQAERAADVIVRLGADILFCLARALEGSLPGERWRYVHRLRGERSSHRSGPWVVRQMRRDRSVRSMFVSGSGAYFFPHDQPVCWVGPEDT